MAMNYSRAFGTALFLLSQALRGQDAASIGQELMALRPGVTAHAWLATHPNDKFEIYPAARRQIVLREGRLKDEPTAFCAVASATLTFGEIQYSRRTYFDLPDAAALSVPADNAPHPELVRQCILSDIELESVRGVDTILLTQIESAISSSLGVSEPFHYNTWKGALLKGADAWVKASEWKAGTSRWIIASRPKDGGFEGVALSSAGNRNPFVPDHLDPGLASARQFLTLARMSADETHRMKELLETSRPSGFGGAGVLPASVQSIVSMLARWAASGSGPGVEARAARLFIAHVALEYAGRFNTSLLNNPDFQKPLKSAGADLFYYEPCACIVYKGNWLVDAWRVAPESPPGRQAYLMQLASGFNVTGTCGGDPDEVVKSGELYLKAHPMSPIRRVVMLHVADGYAEKIALRYAGGPEYGSDNEARKAFPVALQYYRRVMSMAPGSAEARQAKRSAWVMLANPAGLPIRWNCLGGD